MFASLDKGFVFNVNRRADKEKFSYRCSDGYTVLKELPKGQPQIVPPLPIDPKMYRKYLQFVDVPEGHLWK